MVKQPNDLFEFDEDADEPWHLDIINRFRKDALDKIGFDPANMSRGETRFIVSSYYGIQKARLQVNNRYKALTKSGESTSMLSFILAGMKATENNMQKMLASFSVENGIGRWSESIPGIGPVISAGLISEIDITRAPTVGHIWRFAGMDPTSEWLGKEKATEVVNAVVKQRATKTEVTDEQLAQIANTTNRRADNLKRQVLALAAEIKRKLAEKAAAGETLTEEDQESDTNPVVTKGNLIKVLSKRPYNAALKQLVWKARDQFVKRAGKDTKAKGPDIYGKMYADRKLLEIQRNEAGLFADIAYENMAKVGKSTDAYKYNAKGMLPPGHIHARATRYAGKIFLAHWHHVAYELHYGTPPPKPYIIEIGGHTHYIKPPHFPMVDGEFKCDC